MKAAGIFLAGSSVWKMCLQCCLLLAIPGFSQTVPTYLVLLKDKNGTPFQIDKPEAFLSERAIERRKKQNIPIRPVDLPVNPEYLSKIAATGAKVLYASKWFNGAVVSATEAQLQNIRGLPFFAGLERNSALLESGKSGRRAAEKIKTAEPIDYGNARLQLEMLGIPTLHELGHTGSGMLIGVFDAGFRNAPGQPYLKHLFDNGRIADTYDFITGNASVYDDDTHGLEVLSVLAANQPGSLVGPAFGARFALYRTEDAAKETPYEEVTWLIAAERADSLGVDIINTSLGYSTFDDSKFDYTYAQMDGKTTIVSRAARIASRTGMLLVVSAGNDGANSWKYISAPADVDSLLAVGAVDSREQKTAISSIGPNAAGRIKPDVAALGAGVWTGKSSGTVGTSSGTSFASPLIAGMAALVWNDSPGSTAWEISDRIREMGNQADNPDNQLGYGIPFFSNNPVFPGPQQLSASLKNNVVSLSWAYQKDESNAVYHVYRSHHNTPFVLIATVSENELKADTLLESGTYRYRVQAVTGEQKSRYSNIAEVAFTVTGIKDEETLVKIYPNPAKDKIVFHTGASKVYQIFQAVLFTPEGKILSRHEFPTTPVGESALDISTLAAGLYLVRISAESGWVKVFKFVKL